MVDLQTIKGMIAEKLDVDTESVTEETTFEQLGIDSLDMVELIIDIEEELGIDFGEPEGIDTVGKLIDYINSL